MKTKFITLKNGLSVILVDTQAFPSATTLLLIGAGSRYETAQNNGISHFLEHMIFKGSKKYSSSYKIVSLLDGLGGISNAFTSKEYTGYYVKAPSQHFAKVIDVISDIVKNPLIPEVDIEKEKGAITEELNMYLDTPAQDVLDLYEETIYEGNPLSYRIIGSKKNIKSFSRRDFIKYIKTFYYPSNAVLIVAGGLKFNGKDESYFIDKIKTAFNDWKAKETPKKIRFRKKQTGPQIKIHKKKTEQYHFCLGFRTFSYFSANKYALSILSTILGAGMSSRLFVQVRERRGLCYYIHTYSDLYSDTGSMLTHAGVRADKAQLNKAIKLILDEHRKIKNGEITNTEIKRAKEMLKGRFVLALEDTFDVAQYYGKSLLLQKKIHKPKELTDKIDKVTKAEVITVAKEVIQKANLNFAVIGDLQKSDIKMNL